MRKVCDVFDQPSGIIDTGKKTTTQEGHRHKKSTKTRPTKKKQQERD